VAWPPPPPKNSTRFSSEGGRCFPPAGHQDEEKTTTTRGQNGQHHRQCDPPNAGAEANLKPLMRCLCQDRPGACGTTRFTRPEGDPGCRLALQGWRRCVVRRGSSCGPPILQPLKTAQSSIPCSEAVTGRRASGMEQQQPDPWICVKFPLPQAEIQAHLRLPAAASSRGVGPSLAGQPRARMPTEGGMPAEAAGQADRWFIEAASFPGVRESPWWATSCVQHPDQRSRNQSAESIRTCAPFWRPSTVPKMPALPSSIALVARMVHAPFEWVGPNRLCGSWTQSCPPTPAVRSGGGREPAGLKAAGCRRIQTSIRAAALPWGPQPCTAVPALACRWRSKQREPLWLPP